jgi:thiol-disulfide isomerase/thioredoxin
MQTECPVFPRVLLCCLALSVAPALAAPVAPAFSLAQPDGERIEFPAASAGKPSIVLFWATWCPYCERLMPHVQRVYDDYRARGVRWYAITIREDGDPAATLRERRQDPTLLLDGDAVAARWGVFGTPALFVIDGRGRAVYAGPEGKDYAAEEARVRAALDRALSVR